MLIKCDIYISLYIYICVTNSVCVYIYMSVVMYLSVLVICLTIVLMMYLYASMQTHIGKIYSYSHTVYMVTHAPPVGASVGRSEATRC